MDIQNQDVILAFQDALFSKDLTGAAHWLADTLTVENFFPHRGNKKSFLRAMQQLLQAMDEVSHERRQFAQGEQITSTFQVSGKHTRPLDFSFMKLPVVPPSHKRVVWPVSEWEFAIADGKITRIHNLGSLDRGMPGILRAFGLKPLAGGHLAGLMGVVSGVHQKFMAVRPWRFLPLLPLGMLFFVLFGLSSPIDATAWSPQPAPAWEGPLAPNTLLANAQPLGLDSLRHPEDLAFDAQGRLYTGSDDGNIYRITLDGQGVVSTFETFAHTGGYPLGLAFDASGRLLVAVKEVGLLAIDSAGQVQVLTNQVDNQPITYANALVIARNGVVYFTDSSTRFDRGWPYDVLEARSHGRLLAYHPATGQTELIQSGLYFPNGLALAPDESFLLINETTRYRILRYWLTGEQRGTWEPFAENLPILPDNLSSDNAGHYFLAGSRRIALIDALQPNAFLKNQVAKIPLNLLSSIPTQPANRYGLVLRLDAHGTVNGSFHDPSGKVYGVSSARYQEGFLYLGTLFGNDIVRYPYRP